MLPVLPAAPAPLLVVAVPVLVAALLVGDIVSGPPQPASPTKGIAINRIVRHPFAYEGRTLHPTLPLPHTRDAAHHTNGASTVQGATLHDR